MVDASFDVQRSEKYTKIQKDLQSPSPSFPDSASATLFGGSSMAQDMSENYIPSTPENDVLRDHFRFRAMA